MLKNKKQFNHNFSSGFTLVELLVAIAIFSIVIIAVLNIFVTLIKEQKIILAKQEVADNMRYAMEFMNKELRMASTISSASKNGTFSEFIFTNSNCDADSVCHEIIYSLNTGNGTIERNDTYLAVTTGNQAISSDKIKITDLNFIVNNWSSTESPRITVFMKAEKTISSSQKVFMELQSTISPRLY